MIVYQYSMVAREGENLSLEHKLHELADEVRLIAGCEKVDLLRDEGDEHHLLFVEHWSSAEARASGSKHMPLSLLKSLSENLVQPPELSSYRYLR